MEFQQLRHTHFKCSQKDTQWHKK